MLDIPYVKMAAQIAGRFHLDPVEVLKSNTLDWWIRVAALRYLLAEEAEAARRNANTRRTTAATAQ